MSRGFVKEDDQEEVPIVPPRAYLPAGVTNFVTPAGLEKLLAEQEGLIHERDNISSSDENEKRITLNYLNAKLKLLNDRIADARVVDLKSQPRDEIRFGATITLSKEPEGKNQVFQITGVDEADISKGRISFISPFARAFINKKAGETIIVKRDREEIVYKILAISYK